MKTTLNSQDISEYQKNGFIKIKEFLTSDELNIWRNAIGNAIEGRSERIPGFKDSGGTGDDFYDNVFTQRVNLWRTDPAVRKLVLNENIGRMAAKLEKVNAVRIWHDQALYKGPWANATSWHIDNPYWSFHTRHATTIWIALDDTILQNGALYFLPGAHKEATYDNVPLGPNIGSLFDVYADWKDRQPTCIEMKAGDASFHNGLTPHAAGPNMTPGSRRAFAIIFMPEGAVFNGQRNILPEKTYQSLSIGDVMENKNFNPVIYLKP